MVRARSQWMRDGMGRSIRPPTRSSAAVSRSSSFLKPSRTTMTGQRDSSVKPASSQVLVCRQTGEVHAVWKLRNAARENESVEEHGNFDKSRTDALTALRLDLHISPTLPNRVLTRRGFPIEEVYRALCSASFQAATIFSGGVSLRCVSHD